MPDSGVTTVVIACCLLYLLVILCVGLWSGRRISRSVTGFVAADRRMHGVLLYFVIGAAVYSSFAFLGAPGWAYSRGAAAFYVLAFSALGVVPLYFIGPKARQMGVRRGFVTQAEMLGWRFDSPALQGLLALVSVAVFIPYLTLQMKGAGLILETLSEGAIPLWAGAFLSYGVVVTYVWFSGVMGVGWTNAIMGLLMIGTAWFLGLYLPVALYGGIGPMFEQLEAAGHAAALTAPGLDAAGRAWNWWEFSSWILVSAIGFSCWPHIFMKCFTAPSDRQLRLTVVMYPTFQFMMVPLLMVGFAGILAYPGVEPADSILPFMLMQAELPVLVLGIAGVGVLAASMSTGDTILHGAASIAIRDGLQSVGLRPERDATERMLMRFMVLAMAALSYFFAINTQVSIVALLGGAYGGVAQLLPALLAAFYWPRVTGPAVLAGLLGGILVNTFFLLEPGLRPVPLHEGVYGLALNVGLLVGLTLLPPSKHRASSGPANTPEGG